MLVVENATGRMTVEDDGSVVVDWIWGLWEMWKLIEAADSRLIGKFA